MHRAARPAARAAKTSRLLRENRKRAQRGPPASLLRVAHSHVEDTELENAGQGIRISISRLVSRRADGPGRGFVEVGRDGLDDANLFHFALRVEAEGKNHFARDAGSPVFFRVTRQRLIEVGVLIDKGAFVAPDASGCKHVAHV